MLTYESLEQLRAEPPALQFLHLTLLTACRDGASRVEVRYDDAWALVYQRVDGRDWEMLPPPDDAFPDLKAAVRAVSKLTKPERPPLLFTGIANAMSVETPELGWLTYRMGDYWLDLRVWIEPLVPGGWIRFDIDDVGTCASEAASALNAWYEAFEEAA